ISLAAHLAESRLEYLRYLIEPGDDAHDGEDPSDQHDGEERSDDPSRAVQKPVQERIRGLGVAFDGLQLLLNFPQLADFRIFLRHSFSAPYRRWSARNGAAA